jgi:hypothetical protein
LATDPGLVSVAVTHPEKMADLGIGHPLERDLLHGIVPLIYPDPIGLYAKAGCAFHDGGHYAQSVQAGTLGIEAENQLRFSTVGMDGLDHPLSIDPSIACYFYRDSGHASIDIGYVIADVVLQSFFC